MTGLSLTCDRQGGLRRVAVWQGKELRGLYIDKIDAPDLTGAIVGGKVSRVLAGQKAAWLDCGLEEKVFVDDFDKAHSGEYKTVRIKGTARQGKAWAGSLVEGESDKIGILVEPPKAWERALADYKDVATATFADDVDFRGCVSRGEKINWPTDLRFASSGVTEELDEIIEVLLGARVPLAGGGNIVIEQTEALVAVDVNSGDVENALSVNLQAVKETARQVRLRNLAGIVVIDCLKMKLRTDNAKVLAALQRAVVDDPAGVQVFGMTKLGLIEMTRARRGPTLADFFAGA